MYRFLVQNGPHRGQQIVRSACSEPSSVRRLYRSRRLYRGRRALAVEGRYQILQVVDYLQLWVRVLGKIGIVYDMLLKNKQISKQTNKQTNEQTNKQTNKHPNTPQTNRQKPKANKQTNKQTSNLGDPTPQLTNQ